MDEPKFYLWHCRLQGWVTRGGNTNTQLMQAEQFSQTVAKELCIQAKDHNNDPELIPVPVDLLEEILDADR